MNTLTFIKYLIVIIEIADTLKASSKENRIPKSFHNCRLK